ncbi:hypothetical protein NMG29_06465 [Streptomyces cocklensis]|uniref:Uncharacterized protein n=1 Tax=Actinacidiphila cocklensis TaxID=887465 RepID=A0A9W4E3R5_9ACTN|nr:hypothetical protein [Actinacidiphila cocklensis]MDD1057874.1 hypothetical protein [Actinacidiphila cocklensis]CAG6392735.1 hypothetical protein SCOCK_180112 [Actinacidiphila cocklensis]
MKLTRGRRRPSPADLAPVPVPLKSAPPAEHTVPWFERPEAQLTPPPTPAGATPAPVFQPSRYVVQYDRLGQVGDRLTGLRRTPPPLTTHADSAADLAEQIRTDVDPWIGGGARIEVTIDMAVSGGMIRAGVVGGAFKFTRGGLR